MSDLDTTPVLSRATRFICAQSVKGHRDGLNDSVGNLTNIHYPASGTIQFTYDAMNRLATMVDGVGTRPFTSPITLFGTSSLFWAADLT